MRIVIDLQAAQSSGSRNRGIGRYSLSLALAMARNRGEHEVLVALSELFPETIESVRDAFSGILPEENIRVWSAPASVSCIDADNDWRRQTAQLAREAFLASLRPDVVHVSSLFEGLVDDAVTSIGELSRNIPTAVTLYDLIPFIHQKPYLENPQVAQWYLGKLEQLRRADLWLAISESSRQEGVDHLGLLESRAVNISTDADSHFQAMQVSSEQEGSLRAKYGLSRPFVMYTGGIDHRKNIDGLIQAFAQLPDEVRGTHQLAIVCSVHPDARRSLERTAERYGLGKDEVVFTGYVPEDDLVLLYNLCALFVFPSWHEGFGLPALEAMRCGSPVIAANSSSLPEVVGWEEALFDPHSTDSISASMLRALSDQSFRAELVSRQAVQAQSFSWDESARRAIAAMERLHAEHQVECARMLGERERPTLAYVSPLPPERSGIADYSAELLPHLARFYDVEVVLEQDSVADAWVVENCPIRDVRWFVDNAGRYDRVVYHFGNSPFHQHMFELLKTVPGVVVLHDFYLSGIVRHREFLGHEQDGWARELYHSHGYAALRERFHGTDPSDVVWKYPCSLGVIQDSLGVVVHSSQSLRLADEWYAGESLDWSVIPLMRASHPVKPISRKDLGFEEGDFLVCSFGLLGPTKLNKELLEAWRDSELSSNKRCHLVFVGENHPGEYGQELMTMIGDGGMSGNVHVTGWTDMEVFRQYLGSADVAVQLRTLSRGETSAAVLDCMNYGLATVVNANGSMADLDEAAVWMLPDQFSRGQLVEALESLWRDDAARQRLGEAAREVILRNHDPHACAKQYQETIERFYRSAAADINALPGAVAALGVPAGGDAALLSFADAVANGIPTRNRKRQLLVDVSTLVHCDSKSGIQRVVRSILQEWLTNPPESVRVEPVYALADGRGYRYAREFTLKFMGCEVGSIADDWVEFAPGDVFIGLDLQHHVVVSQQTAFERMRHSGVKVKFVVYDLLPILLPQVFMPGMAELHDTWIRAVAQSDGAVCISKSVADELSGWLQDNVPERHEKLAIDWFHLGADVENSLPSMGLPENSDAVLSAIGRGMSFLMVGTIEPRKGHAQVLDAFDLLWQAGCDANLVIVGKQGWLVDELVETMRSHPERGRRLFWFEGASDELLEKLYDASTCLIAASYGEGFGLPLIEAAQHGLPVMARDLAVFQEVAGAHAYYFSGETPERLAEAIDGWMQAYREKRHPVSEGMPWLTWKESAQQLSGKLVTEVGVTVDA